MALITVAVPAYNASVTLERTLRSVQAQTHSDIEVFIVDDGSADATFELAKIFAAQDRRFQIVRQENSGVAAARNVGLRHASGKYITWIDADDLWHPTKIEKQLQVFQRAKTPLSFVYTGYRLVDENDRIIPNFRTLADISGHTICRQIATNFFSNVSSIMVPTGLARRFGGHDPRLRDWGVQGSEDLLLQLQLSTLGPAGCVQEALVGYRMHQDNMSLDHLRSAKSNLKALELIEHSTADIPAWVFRLGRARTAGYCLHLLRDGRPAESLKTFISLFRRQPGYTLLVLALIAGWETRKAVFSGLGADPALGTPFSEADPASVPWLGHMVLTSWHRKLLDEADARRIQPGIAVPPSLPEPGGTVHSATWPAE
ncbi:MAG TPA: glycosyltransferase family A protein [Alphaproteobacteria bacterium]|nr:glycosyltransferase family A protein [Alphaproteobacteria bacterium]